jgi:nitrogen fixation/metabolism regulation signal transduction histidine kinase
MSEVLHANIFFIIASVATVIFFILLCFIIFQVYKILKLVRSVMERVESTSEVLAGDIAHIREMMANGGWFGRLVNFILGAASTESRRKKKSRD